MTREVEPKGWIFNLIYLSVKILSLLLWKDIMPRSNGVLMMIVMIEYASAM